jgi:putative FmdB family regulatory protein
MPLVPIYEYRCQHCDRSFEVLTSFTERDGLQPCPTCESTQTRVQVSSFAAIGGPDPGGDVGPQMLPSGGGGC